MKTPVLIVVIASVVVLCTLPAVYLFLAYYTYRERQRWKLDHDRALEKMELEGRCSPRAASAVTTRSILSSPAPGRASSSAQQHYDYRYHPQRQPHTPARPAPIHNPNARPPRPPRARNVVKPRSSQAHLSQADAVPLATLDGSGRTRRTAPGSKTRTGSAGADWSSRGSGRKESAHEATSDEVSVGKRPSSSVNQF